MSACIEIAPLIAFRTLGVLEPREKVRLEEHLATCSSCPERAQALKKALDVTKLPEVRAPEGGWEKIEAAIKEPRELSVGVACTYCKDSFGGALRVFCAACLAPYHADCFREHGKCAVAGCGETKVVQAQTLTRSARPRSPIALLTLLVAGGVGGVAAWALRPAHAPGPPRVAEKPAPTESMPRLLGRDYSLLDPAKPGLDYFEPEHLWTWKVEGYLVVGDNSEAVGPNTPGEDHSSSLYFGDASWNDVDVRLRFRIRKGALAIRVHCMDAAYYEPVVVQQAKRNGELVPEWQECHFLLRGNDFTYTTSFGGFTSTPSHLTVSRPPGRLALSLPAGAIVELEQVSVTLPGDAREPVKNAPEEPVTKKKPKRPSGDSPLSVVRYPEDAPVYAVVGTVPRETLEEYARFAGLVRAKLVDLIESGSGKKIPWTIRPCKTCQGKTVLGEKKCPQCGGTGREPSTIYILGSVKDFMEKTHAPEGVGAFYFPAGNFEFYERPVVTFHDEAAKVERLGALAHETTHQTEQLAWAGDGVGALYARPAWLMDGLAMLMGEGLDLTRREEGVLGFEVPRDRLRQVRRRLEATPDLRLDQILSLDLPRFQMDPSLLAFAWSIVHYMALSGEKLEVQGRTVDLHEAFARFFLDNCERGAIEELGSERAALGLARAMGFTIEKDSKAALDALEVGWKHWVNTVEVAPLGGVVNGRYGSSKLGLSLGVPEGFVMEPESALRPFEAVAFKAGERRFEVVVTASTGVKDLASGARLAGYMIQEKVEPSGDGAEVSIEGATARLFDIAGGKALVALAHGRVFVVMGDSSAVTDASRSLHLESR